MSAAMLRDLAACVASDAAVWPITGLLLASHGAAGVLGFVARTPRPAPAPKLVTWGNVRCTPAQHAELARLHDAAQAQQARGEYPAAMTSRDDFAELLEQCKQQWGTIAG